MHNSYQNLLSIQSEIKKEFDNKPDKFIVPNIIAVSKAFSLEHINPLIKAGHLHFGENKIQEAEKKWIDIKKINSALESNPSDYNETFFEKYQSKKNMLALYISKWGNLQKEHEKLNK